MLVWIPSFINSNQSNKNWNQKQVETKNFESWWEPKNSIKHIAIFIWNTKNLIFTMPKYGVKLKVNFVQSEKLFQ